MKRFAFHPEAAAELRQAIRYYEARRPGLGKALRLEVLATRKRIQVQPRGFRMDEHGLRHAHLRRFPYSILYLELKDRLWTPAVPHDKRRPDYWLHRRPDDE